MKNLILCIVSICLLILMVSCSINPALSTEGIVKELAGEKYEGRLVGSAGNEKAAQFLADYFRNIGIEPLFDSGYFQEYPQKAAVPSEQQPEIVVTNPDGTQYKLTYGDDYILHTAAEDLSVNMPLTFDTADKNSRGSVAVIPVEQLASLNKECNIAIVSCQTLRFAPSIPQPGDRLIIAVPEKVREKLMADKAKSVTIKIKAAVRDYTARNVVAAIKGEDSKRAIVFTAHFDHAGKQGSRIFPGALDNASGTAALLSAAVKIKEALGGRKPAADIVFACVNAEESALLPGSTALVETLSNQYAELFNVNIDCVGGKNGGPLLIGPGDGQSGDLIQELRSYFQKNTVDISADIYDGFSDHESFIKKGYGAIVIGQLGMEAMHIEADTAGTIDSGLIDRIAASVSEFVLADGAAIFDSLKQNTNTPPGFKSDDIEWMRRAYQEKDRILAGRKLKYNEVIYYMYDGESLRHTGARPLTSIEEIRQYYPQTSFPESILDYEFDSASFLDLTLSSFVLTGNLDKELKGRELNTVYEAPTDISNVLGITIEYRKVDDFLLIGLSDSSMAVDYISGGDPVREPLEGDYSGYSLNRNPGEEKYYSFSYVSGKWCIEVSVFKKWAMPNLYDESKSDMFPDYNTQVKTKDEMLALIDALDIRGKADAFISNAGLPK